MNNFLVQVQLEGYNTIIQNRRYSNAHWKKKSEGDKSKKWENKYNIDHGMVKSDDRLLVYCGSQVPNRDHKNRLAFSVDVRSVSDNKTFKLREPQFFSDPLKREDIPKYIEQGKLDECFGYCGSNRHQGFNITKLEPTAVQQLLNVVEPKISPPSPSQDRHQTVLGRVWRAVLAAVRHLRRRFQRRDRGGEA